MLFLTLEPEIQFRCAEKISLHRVRDSMGVTLEPVLGLLRYVSFCAPVDRKLTDLTTRVTKNLLHLADPDFAASLERYYLSHTIPLLITHHQLALRPSHSTLSPTYLHSSPMICRPSPSFNTSSTTSSVVPLLLLFILPLPSVAQCLIPINTLTDI